MYCVWHNCVFILLLFYYWLLVSASKGHLQASIYKNLKTQMRIVQKLQFFGILFTFISRLYNYYQPLYVLSVVICIEIYIVSTMECITKIFFDWQPCDVYKMWIWCTQLLYQPLHIYKIYKILHIKTLKPLLHVSVLGPSSGSRIVLAKVTLLKVTLISLYRLVIVAACRVV